MSTLIVPGPESESIVIEPKEKTDKEPETCVLVHRVTARVVAVVGRNLKSALVMFFNVVVLSSPQAIENVPVVGWSASHMIKAGELRWTSIKAIKLFVVPPWLETFIMATSPEP